jgi:hypothetical protein
MPLNSVIIFRYGKRNTPISSKLWLFFPQEIDVEVTVVKICNKKKWSKGLLPLSWRYNPCRDLGRSQLTWYHSEFQRWHKYVLCVRPKINSRHILNSIFSTWRRAWAKKKVNLKWCHLLLKITLAQNGTQFNRY